MLSHRMLKDFAVPATVVVLGTAHLALSQRRHRQRQELLAADLHDGILADIIRSPETDPAWSANFDPWVKPGEDAEYFTLQRWLEWYRRGLLAGVVTVSQMKVNADGFMALRGGSLMWALTRDARWEQSSDTRSGRLFWHLINEAFRGAGGEDDHAEAISAVRERRTVASAERAVRRQRLRASEAVKANASFVSHHLLAATGDLTAWFRSQTGPTPRRAHTRCTT